MARSFWYCFTSAFFGSVRIFTSAPASSSSSTATTGQAADEFRDEAVLDQVLGLHVLQELVHFLAGRRGAHLRAEPMPEVAVRSGSPLQPAERAAANEQDVRVSTCTNSWLVLAPALPGHRGDGALDQLQSGLLHALRSRRA